MLLRGAHAGAETSSPYGPMHPVALGRHVRSCHPSRIAPTRILSGFPKSVCVSVNEVRHDKRQALTRPASLAPRPTPPNPHIPPPLQVICHGIPDSRPLEEGDIVNLDVSLFSEEGYHADLNETYAVGAWRGRNASAVTAPQCCP